MVRSINENFVDDLEKSRDILDLPVHHPLLFRVVCPHDLAREFDTPYVHVWAF